MTAAALLVCALVAPAPADSDQALRQVVADYVDAGETSRGRLALVLMLDGGTWKIQSLALAYQ